MLMMAKKKKEKKHILMWILTGVNGRIQRGLEYTFVPVSLAGRR
jgi:hypothetical protein